MSDETKEESRPQAHAEPGRDQGQGSNPRGEGRVAPDRAPELTQSRSVQPRKAYAVRSTTYRLRTSEIQTLAELGKFRTLALKDLEKFAYHGDKGLMRPDIQNLIRQGLVLAKTIPHHETGPR